MRNHPRNLLTVCLLLMCTMLHAEELDNKPQLNRAALQAIANLPAIQGASATDFEDINGKPVLVTFFASWCPPCKEEFAHLNELRKKYADTDLRILAINVFEAWDENDVPRMEKFISATQPQFPAVKGSEAIRDLFGGVDRIPTVLGFDSQGNPAYKFTHKRNAKITNASFSELDEAATKLLALQ